MKKILILTLLFVALLAAACASQNASNNGAIPTPTLIPTYRFVPPTEAPQIATAAAATESVTVTQAVVGIDPERVARGKDRYAALDCGKCHGANGEGGSAPAVNNVTMSQDAFISFMRSGGKLGKDHQYSTNRLSESGGQNLYLYLQSLKSGS